MSDNKNKISPSLIRGKDSGSFAKYTIDTRLPHIIKEIKLDNNLDFDSMLALDNLENEIKFGEITKLKEERLEDSELWNRCVLPYIGNSWYEVPFLFAEMYFYRRILEAVDAFNVNREDIFDPFKTKKELSLVSADKLIKLYASQLSEAFKSQYYTLDRLGMFMIETMWSNSNDLSQMPGDIGAYKLNGKFNSADFLLIDELSIFLMSIKGKNKLKQVDIILDNCGAELLADLMLVCYMLDSNVADTIILHCKKHPIFVSDATIIDVNFTLDYLKNNLQAEVAGWGERLSYYIDKGRVVLNDAFFWSLPINFRDMPKKLFASFESSDLVILKGDVNYRRLVEDRYWSHEKPLKNLVQYLPTNFLILRVLKSEVLVGLDTGKISYSELSKNWMTEGKYGVIQYININ